MYLALRPNVFRRSVPALISLLAMATAACDSSPGGDRSPDANSEPPADSYELTWGPLSIPPGVEGVQCVVKRLGNDVPVKINRIDNELGGVSHHYIIYATPETEERPEPHPCDSIQNLIDQSTGAPLMITQKYEETLTLPEGVAFALEADQMIRLELHYINASDTPREVTVTSTFYPIAEAAFEHAADFLFIGNPDVELPPRQASTLGPSYMTMPAELAGSKFFGFTGHTHQWGTNVYVEMAADENDPGIAVYDLPDFDWDEPETVYYDPPVELPQYGGFRFTCDWYNDSDRTVRFGEGVDDEMCFFWAYYYPSKGARTCFHTTALGSPLDVCCPGNQLCNLIEGYF
jgi:hypothetical protein